MKIYKYCFFGLLAALLVACGGGGGDAKTPDSDGGSKANVITLTVVAQSTDTVVNSITFGGNQRIKVKYANYAGAAIPNTSVTFSVTENAEAVSLTQTKALTNEQGVAYVYVSPSSASVVGAATVKVTVGTVSNTVDFGISATRVSLGKLKLGGSETPGTLEISSGGTTPASITASANSAQIAGVSVSFSADCGTMTPAIGLTDGNGQATSTYSALKADGTSCSGSVTVSAIAAGSTQTNSLSVLSPVASAINFVSASPSQIYVRGSGALSQSIVKFKVLNASGGNLSGASVRVSLTANRGGVGLNAVGSTSDLTLPTDNDGVVTFTVFSGTLPGPLEVKAEISGSDTYAVSKNLTVQSGPPSQKFFSLAADRYNIEGKDYEGTTATITVRAADRNGNPTPVGTVINFTAEGGQVSPSCTIALVGGIASCTATFSSQSPRPADMRISILAYAEGMKDYVDNNKNNTFDSGDTLSDMGDAYRDDNDESQLKQYDSGEFTISRGGTLPCVGAGGSVPAVANTCTGTPATTVRKQLVLTMSGSVAVFNKPVWSTSEISFTLTDDNRVRPNPMPDGTTILATALDNTADNDLTCTVKPGYGTTLSGTSSGIADVVIRLKDCAIDDEVNVDVTTPKGNKTSTTFTIKAPPPP